MLFSRRVNWDSGMHHIHHCNHAFVASFEAETGYPVWFCGHCPVQQPLAVCAESSWVICRHGVDEKDASGTMKRDKSKLNIHCFQTDLILDTGSVVVVDGAICYQIVVTHYCFFSCSKIMIIATKTVWVKPNSTLNPNTFGWGSQSIPNSQEQAASIDINHSHPLPIIANYDY